MLINRHLAALITYARAARLLSISLANDGTPIDPGVTIHRSHPGLIGELLPIVADSPGIVVALADDHGVVINLEIPGIARVAIFSEDPRVAGWAPPAGMRPIDASLRRWEHERDAGVAVLIAASDDDDVPMMPEDYRTAYDPHTPDYHEGWMAADHELYGHGRVTRDEDSYLDVQDRDYAAGWNARIDSWEPIERPDPPSLREIGRMLDDLAARADLGGEG